MKNIIAGLNKLFDSRVRLGIMAILMVNESADFNTLKELLQITDGNLATHLKALENGEAVVSTKQFVGRKPNTTYAATVLGRKLFKQHLRVIEGLIGNK